MRTIIQIFQLFPIIIHNRQSFTALSLGPAFGDKNHAAVEISAFACDAAVNFVGDLMGHAAPVRCFALKLQSFAVFLPRKHIVDAETDCQFIPAARGNGPRDQNLCIDRLPVRIFNRGVQAGNFADMGALIQCAKQSCAHQIHAQNRNDIPRKFHRTAVLRDKSGGREGHGFDHPIRNLNPQGLRHGTCPHQQCKN